jgi:class 3 adenylate cyclase
MSGLESPEPEREARVSALPTGTVTFLFTDIEGSTRLLQELGERYRALQDRHAEIIRGVLEAEQGHEVRTEGDSFFAVFPQPRTCRQYVGEMAVISQEPRVATLICAEPVRTLSLDRRSFERILRERPAASLAVMRVLCDRLRECHDGDQAQAPRGAR